MERRHSTHQIYLYLAIAIPLIAIILTAISLRFFPLAMKELVNPQTNDVAPTQIHSSGSKQS